MEDGAEIRRLHMAEGMSIKAIVRLTRVSPNTVRRAVASTDPPKYVRRAKGSAVDAFEPAVRALLQVYPSMPATVLAERVGWARSMSVFNERVRELRPHYRPVDPPRARPMSRASWPSATCGSRRRRSRWVPGRPALRRCW